MVDVSTEGSWKATVDADDFERNSVPSLKTAVEANSLFPENVSQVASLPSIWYHGILVNCSLWEWGLLQTATSCCLGFCVQGLSVSRWECSAGLCATPSKDRCLLFPHETGTASEINLEMLPLSEVCAPTVPKSSSFFVARNLSPVVLHRIKPHFIVQIWCSHLEVAENPNAMLPASGSLFAPHPLFLSPWPRGRKPLCEVLIWNNFSTLVFVFCWITGQRAYLWRSFLFYFFAVHSSN